MKRMKRHKVKKEKAEASSSFTKEQEEHDLAYYIHDRVELMHQVFSSLKYKEIKAMAPECVRHISIDDLQELCTEELLGISSKRLCAILDGAEPPSDTESSSQSPSPPLETISLDSISSDDEILSETSKSSRRKKKHKHKHSKDRSKKKEKRKSNDSQPEEDAELSRASRAGLTVLELLELQARARAIRAQLQKEQTTKPVSESAPPESAHSSDNEVEIKEEPAEVVEISSEDEKPNIEELEKETRKAQDEMSRQEQHSTVKRISDLIITIPQSKQTRKIKLNRSKASDNTNVAGKTNPISGASDKNSTKNKNGDDRINIEANKSTENSRNKNSDSSRKENNTKSDTANKISDKATIITKNKVKKTKIKKKKKEKKVSNIEEDHDEITLQLSDSEKMDLLEDLDRKNFENVSSSCTEDSESSSDTSDDADSSLERENTEERSSNTKETGNAEVRKAENVSDHNECPKNTAVEDDRNTSIKNVQDSTVDSIDNIQEDLNKRAKNSDKVTINNENFTENNDSPQEVTDTQDQTNANKESQNMYKQQTDNTDKSNYALSKISSNETEKHTNTSIIDKIREDSKNDEVDENAKNEDLNTNSDVTSIKDIKDDENNSNGLESNTKDNTHTAEIEDTSSNTDKPMDSDNTNRIQNAPDTESSKDVNKETTATDKKLSDGELTDNESSEIEVTDLKPEVVCISDEEVGKKKKKKKDKKKKKSKKKDFREGSDQNFFKDNAAADTIYMDNFTATDNCTKDIIMNEDKNRQDITVIDATDEDSKSNADNREAKETVYIIIEDEILILSDDSSCYEVDTYLSKEPTTEEIEALSLKIDEINRDEIVSERDIYEYEKQLRDKEAMADKHNPGNIENTDNDTVDAERDNNITNRDKENEMESINSTVENMSWKERYLGSKKVKKVLSTASIFNALRKKNIELKKKLEENRKEEEQKNLEQEKEQKNLEQEKESAKKEELEMGSIEHYNTLQGSTKYVDPVRDIADNEKDEKGVTREMKRDAKQLLKMYKKLLKYNDMNKVKDPNKKKKKKKTKDLEKLEVK